MGRRYRASWRRDSTADRLPVEFGRCELVVTGEATERKRAGPRRTHSSAAGRFPYRVMPPAGVKEDEVKEDEVTASLTDGMLTARVHNKRARQRKIPIQPGTS